MHFCKVVTVRKTLTGASDFFNQTHNYYKRVLVQNIDNVIFANQIIQYHTTNILFLSSEEKVIRKITTSLHVTEDFKYLFDYMSHVTCVLYYNTVYIQSFPSRSNKFTKNSLNMSSVYMCMNILRRYCTLLAIFYSFRYLRNYDVIDDATLARIVYRLSRKQEAFCFISMQVHIDH